MSLRLQPPLPSVPDDTARIARAAFRRGNPYLLLRDRLGAVFADAGFAGLYPALGQPAYTLWRLALVTLMQFRGLCCRVCPSLGSRPFSGMARDHRLRKLKANLASKGRHFTAEVITWLGWSGDALHAQRGGCAGSTAGRVRIDRRS
ncbi:hypothetical protein GCM10011504_48800 [Siccirubricoccus deserti]|nr:hypothetical protein GCM10011504_48800 [Siccirubricoccus deserti]